ncbi:branched-chain-amino-acid aminotransferase-like protein 1 [Cucumis melo var. makuwa]|uniref:Branched-chain-amino-acid aminotransferase-like protein 1 n=1 Tax=Cucumis melo var. makuwa TaxID=1194695 RepID=A0A5D3DGU8_CUCMM|nr:branched-chain-amino-acid aminotransferase-like protein 1 [Cucumis melo var. makuwa]TYK22499.1 branched-chain-amino-acid aminotransferase-like protein 1 [Cucumis melo var. makuwa]
MFGIKGDLLDVVVPPLIESITDGTLVKSLKMLAEWKPPVYDNSSGITLVTVTTRRNSPNIEGNNANAGDAIMLDKDGFVSETNAPNIVLSISRK